MDHQLIQNGNKIINFLIRVGENARKSHSIQPPILKTPQLENQKCKYAPIYQLNDASKKDHSSRIQSHKKRTYQRLVYSSLEDPIIKREIQCPYHGDSNRNQQIFLATKSKINDKKTILNQNKVKFASRNRLYQIPINSTKLKQKCDKNVVSFLKIPNLSQQNSTLSNNFDTYLQFKQYMSKLSKQSPNQCKKIKNDRDSDKRCIIVPALRPPFNYKQKRTIDQFQDYLIAKKAKQTMEKSFIIQSKKKKLLAHVSTRYKAKSKLQYYHIIEDKNILPNIQEGDFNKNDDTRNKDEDISRKTLSHAPNHTYRKKPNKISSFFIHNQGGIYEQKMKSYRELLFIVNLAHRVFDPIIILDPVTLNKSERNLIPRYTYFVGPGNNSMLVRSLMKKRIWWSEVQQQSQANFVWTQLKINSIFQRQKSSQVETFDKIESNQENKQANETLLLFSIKNKNKQSNKSNQFISEKLFTAEKCSYSTHQSKRFLIPACHDNIFPKKVMFKAPFAYKQQSKILTFIDSKYYNLLKNIIQNDCDQLQNRLKLLPKNLLIERNQDENLLMHNHLQFNHSLGNKKSLFYHMQLYYKLTNQSISQAFPKTFHIKHGQRDPQFTAFLIEHQRISREEPDLKNIWILKPGENSNRGTGITVIKQLKILKKLIRNKQGHRIGDERTFILQKYIEKPLLFKNRKFDIRHYMVISSFYGRMRAYLYGQGYVRTSSYSFSLKEIKDPMIHLTNDAIQKQSEDYGCHEDGNKVSYNQLQKYFTTYAPEKRFNINEIYSKMRDLATSAISSTYFSINKSKKYHNFQVFGLDFMIDDQLDVMLIEVNTNPCLQLSCNLLDRVIPSMLQQSFRLTLDVIFPPTIQYTNNTRHLAPDCSLQKLQLQLIFDSGRDGKWISDIYLLNISEYLSMMHQLQGSQMEEDDVYENQGQQIDFGKLNI